MTDAPRARVFSMPAHRAFADALAIGLLRRHGGDWIAFSRGIILVPNNRAKQALQAGFVRQSGGGLLMPRMVAIGDLDLDEGVGAALDPIDAPPLLPVVSTLQRSLILAQLVQDAYREQGRTVSGAEALAQADALGRALDQLQVERIAPDALDALALEEGLADHWQQALDLFRRVLGRWPDARAKLGLMDRAERRNQLMDQVARRWRNEGSAAPFIVAAGITIGAPAIAGLLRVVAHMPQGMVVLPDLDLAMPQEEWDALGPHDDADGVATARSIETHPQFHLKLLLHRMGVTRDEVEPWRVASDADAPSARSAMVSNAFAPAAYTGKWRALPGSARSLAGVTAIEAANPAEEAQAIALAMRRALEEPGATAALVTPDRELATRVSAHLDRWGIAADDSAGRPLTKTPPGTLALAAVHAATSGFAPVELMALLKHPLVMAADTPRRLAWLDAVRTLDRALRGPRPGPGLTGIEVAVVRALGDNAGDAEKAAFQRWWSEVRTALDPLAAAFAPDRFSDLRVPVQALVGALNALGEPGVWTGPAGRALADLLTEIAGSDVPGPADVARDDIAPMLERLMMPIAVRPPQGGHPRLFIWGLIEAQLQRADLMILGGLNEGVWPGQPQPDPWLAPGIRRRLGLPGLERTIGLAAHEFASGLAAPRVLLSRARRDQSAPAVASRFWLRLEAMAGGLPRGEQADDLVALTRALDAADARSPAPRPAVTVPAHQRPRRISVTQLDRLRADPFAFYAQSILGLDRLDTLDADASAAWRGSAVHAVLERWALEGDTSPEALRRMARARLESTEVHPVVRALWRPRLLAAIDWIAATMEERAAAGWRPALIEQSGTIEIAGIALTGKVDRLDIGADGSVAIVDYKTGQPPSPAAINAGYSLQLGLLGLIAERGGFEALGPCAATTFEYWSLARNRSGGFGFVASPFAARPGEGDVTVEDFVAQSAAVLAAAAGRWLTGNAPFIAKLEPDFAPYADYDQLMRLQEWYGI